MVSGCDLSSVKMDCIFNNGQAQTCAAGRPARGTPHVANEEVVDDGWVQARSGVPDPDGEVIGVEPEDVTRGMRSQAKVINFGIIYGMSAYGLSRELGISPGEASAIIEEYFNVYSGVRAFTDLTLTQAREKGYVNSGETVVFTAGIPLVESPHTNMIKIQKV